MPCYAYQGIIPVVDPRTFVHPLASLVGDVIIGPGCYVGPGASLRGDFGRIIVEANCSIQDTAVIHTSSESDTQVRGGTTIAHGAVIHGCDIGANVIVGINAVVLDGAVIGDECCVGALTLVRSGCNVPPRSLVVGNPARIIRTLHEREISWRDGAGVYPRLARESLSRLVETAPLAAPEPSRPRHTAEALPIRVRS
jgi:phenylacetic acid degradation protein